MLLTIAKRTIHYFEVKAAIKHANEMSRLCNGKRFYVMKVYNKIRVYDRNRVDVLVNAGVFANKLRDSMELNKAAIYHTPDIKPITKPKESKS